MNLQSLPDRTCLWCHAPFQGRIDKKFCKSACKASHSRHAAVDDYPFDTARTNSRPSVATRPQLLATIDWQTRCEQAEQALQDYLQRDEQALQAAVPFDQEYNRLTKLMLQYGSLGLSLAAVTYMLPQLQAGIEQYQQHPELSNPHHAASHRLGTLQNMQWFLQNEYRRLLSREQELHAYGSITPSTPPVG